MARHKTIFNLWQTHVNTNHFENLAAPIHTARAGPARCLALAQTYDQVFTQLANSQGIDRAIDHLVTNVGTFMAGNIHAARLVGNLFGGQTLTQQMSHQLQALAPR